MSFPVHKLGELLWRTEKSWRPYVERALKDSGKVAYEVVKSFITKN